MATKKEIIQGRIDRTMRDMQVYKESPYQDKQRDKQQRKDFEDSLKELRKQLKDVNEHKWKGTM